MKKKRQHSTLEDAESLLSEMTFNSGFFLWGPLFFQSLWQTHANMKKLKTQKEKTTMKPFNIEEAKAGKPVCTRDGRDVEILKYDMKDSHYPIVGVIHNSDREDVLQTFTEDGYLRFDRTNDSRNLMMKSEKKEGWVNVYKNSKGQPFVYHPIFSSEEYARTVIDEKNFIATVKIEWEE